MKPPAFTAALNGSVGLLPPMICLDEDCANVMALNPMTAALAATKNETRIWCSIDEPSGSCGAGDRFDVGEHAASVPGWEGSYERRGAIELDAALVRSLGPGELPRVPFDEGFGVRRDVEILVELGVRLADL